MSISDLSGQLPLEFIPEPYMGKEDFMIAACNFEAFKLVDSWPDWPFFAICIYGPQGCGKTHLATIFAHTVSTLTHWPYKIPCIKAKDVCFESLEYFNLCQCLIVEDLDEQIDNEALFHLYNHYRNEGGYILFTSQQAPARMHFSLPDLQSRMNIVPSVEINEPDDEMLSALFIKLFTDRQITVAPEVINYMLHNTQRSFAYACKLVAEIDNISLAKKRAVTIAIVKEAINVLNDNPQGELFS